MSDTILHTPPNTGLPINFGDSLRRTNAFGSDRTQRDNEFSSRIETLKKRISFKSLLKRDGYSLRTTGKNPQCSCPFHQDNTPSFTIYDDSRAHCFGCRWSGDIIKYYRETRKVGFLEA